jgi:hypothetical protein
MKKRMGKQQLKNDDNEDVLIMHGINCKIIEINFKFNCNFLSHASESFH